MLEQLAEEKSGHVRYAIGRVLAEVNLEDSLRPNLQSTDAATRAAACFAVGWAKDGQCLEVPLRVALNDLAEPVIDQAMAALDRLNERAICEELAARASASEELAVKWLYLDALVDVMDPGEEFRPWPAKLQSACKELSSLVCKVLNDRIKKCRKGAARRAQKEVER